VRFAGNTVLGRIGSAIGNILVLTDVVTLKVFRSALLAFAPTNRVPMPT
jgi:hypothetical protein